MADDFWKAVYNRLADNSELLKLICFDTSNNELLSWIKPNQRLYTRCMRYLYKGNVSNRAGLIDEILSYASTDNPLRRIILLTWIDKNQNSMAFLKIPGNSEAIERLASGEFGNFQKIKILSYIDPREGSGKLYKEILEKCEAEEKMKVEKENQEKAEPTFGDISNAELEAALHSKDMISAPDKNEWTYDGSFNAVVYEELEKIKAALEILQDVNKQLKTENKNLRDEQSKRHIEVSNYSSKLQSSVAKNQKLSSELEKEKNKNSSLSSQLAAARAEINSKPVPTISESEVNDLRFRLDEALKENQELKQKLNNREASLNRIKTENIELHLKIDSATEQSQLVSNLQQKLANLEIKTSAKLTYVVGQIVSKTKYDSSSGEKAGKKCWLFKSYNGQIFYFDLADIPNSLSVPEEYLLITLDGDKVVSVQSLDEDKKEVYGVIKLVDGKGILVADTEEIPIFLEITEKWAERPARGILLSELENREGGIYKIEILPTAASLKKSNSKSGGQKYSEKSENNKESEYSFNGQKVLIFGGDRVGLEYEKALGKAGLSAKWFSGFSLLSEISLGFGKPDLMVIVTKQISHALLRELNAYAEKHSLTVVYSTKRGITSVLECCKEKLDNKN